jgi:DNA-binding CsgD family transcriptional regulator/tetratricopeptide (TPR) repeat protein
VPGPRDITFVGRDRELAELTAALSASPRRGSMIHLWGQAGVGKSRLVSELMAVARPRMPVLVGRAVGHGPPQAYRPLAEALQAGLRIGLDRALPQDVDPFRPALGRLLPQWRAPGGIVETSPVALGEGILRLLRGLATPSGLLMVLEDLHWMDADTRDVLEYMADNVADSSSLIVLTARRPATETEPLVTSTPTDDLAVRDLVRRTASRGSVQVMDIDRLDPPATRVLITALLGPQASPGLLEAIALRSAGLPLLAHEIVSAGRAPTEQHAAIPRSVAEAVATRVEALPAHARSSLDIAAVLGERFETDVLGAVVPDETQTLEALRAAVRSEILVVRSDGGFAFRHAVVRDAVLARLLPPERAEIAGSALRAVRALHPELPDVRCALAAQLAHTAGDDIGAGELLGELGLRDLARGALGAAEGVLRQAAGLALPDALAADVLETLGRVLVEAGRPADATTAIEQLLATLARLDPDTSRAADAHLGVARAWVVAGRWDRATEHTRLARSHDRRAAAPADLIDALTAIGQGRFDEAERLAGEALRRGTADRDGECEALLVLGQLARRTDLAAAEDLFTQALGVADENDLAVWRTRALHELATVDLFDGLRTDRAEMARDHARRAGAVALGAMAGYHLASILCWRGEHDRALSLLRDAEDTCRTLRLPLLAMVLVMQAEVHAQLGHHSHVDPLCEEAESHAPGDPHVRAATQHARATTCLLEDDRAGALAALDAATGILRTHDVATPWGPPMARWALLATLERKAPAWPEVAALPGADQARWTIGHLALARAIDLGRTGDHAGAAAEFTRGNHALAHPVPMPHFRHVARRLVAEAALADGWGDPVTWLRETIIYFEDAGLDTMTNACRALLRRSGAPVARRTPGPPIPTRLRHLGVTGREMEVLQLVVAGLTNAQIAERLVLSRRTVEKHIAHLLRKTGSRDRSGLMKHIATADPNHVPVAPDHGDGTALAH